MIRIEPVANAVVYCEGAFGSTYGKTAHGLIRRSHRYRISSVIDSSLAGEEAGAVLGLDRPARRIPIVPDLHAALKIDHWPRHLTHFVIGLAPDGGRLTPELRGAVDDAIRHGLNIDSGLHDLLSEDPDLSELSWQRGVKIRDVRDTPARSQLHFFTGKIREVRSYRVAVLGTDSAVGKRTTAWALLDGLNARRLRAELVGTGQTAWLQGARYGIVLDALVNDFVAGELEHAVWSAWDEVRPDVIVIEGQGSLMNPAYPGGYEILAAARPHGVVLQHAPGRRDYDGFPGYPIQPLDHQIRAIELVSGRPVIGIAINPENLDPSAATTACSEIEQQTGLAAVDVLREGADRLVGVIAARTKNLKRVA
jgi:uncharacterized NAD-dependent epimerase/dehydratase family protein